MATKKPTEDEEKHLWSGTVTEHEKWHSPPGLFNREPEEIAKVLKDSSTDERQAMSRLTFYENRAGKNLSSEDRERLEKAKAEIRIAFGKEES